MSSTSAAPGDNPLSISAAAIGIDPVAQRYIGIEKSSTTAIFSSGLSANEAKKVVGHQNRNQPCDEQSQHQPAADVLDHIHESVAQRLHEPAAAATNLAAFRRRKDTVGLAAGQPIDRPPARQRRHERHDGPDHGEGKAQYRVGRHDRIDAGLRRGDQKRRHGTLRRPLAPQRHRRGNHAARTQGQRHAEEGGQRHRAEIGLRR